ncbi:hypothetical protein [Solirubrum puertoriconensis]|uniref:Uncharacterized protein n=1 Tax=Solirubrum puertoriconensis TaxID=1751427 RepID=A0A9X0HJ80_SOLP1|nr:hypothetical protein [Solirubrum puertoriconensis]KUG06902.1 hypothetical protein ASU33_06140 [Solirubrum puertoriconensis]
MNTSTNNDQLNRQRTADAAKRVYYHFRNPHADRSQDDDVVLAFNQANQHRVVQASLKQPRSAQGIPV